MSGKDILTLILASYGFNEIKISIYRGVANAHGYKIDAFSENHNIHYNEENCEGLMFNYVDDFPIKEVLKMFK